MAARRAGTRVAGWNHCRINMSAGGHFVSRGQDSTQLAGSPGKQGRREPHSCWAHLRSLRMLLNPTKYVSEQGPAQFVRSQAYSKTVWHQCLVGHGFQFPQSTPSHHVEQRPLYPSHPPCSSQDALPWLRPSIVFATARNRERQHYSSSRSSYGARI